MDRAMNTTGHRKNVVDGLNATNKCYLKGEMELMSILSIYDITNIGMLPSASKYVSVSFTDQCLHTLNYKEIFNGLKGSTNMKKRQSEFKYQISIYIIQRTLMLITEV